MVFSRFVGWVFSVRPAFSHFPIGSCFRFTLLFAFLPFGKSLWSWNKVFFFFCVCVCCVAAVWLVCVLAVSLMVYWMPTSFDVIASFFWKWEAAFQPSVVSSSLSWCASINGHYVNSKHWRPTSIRAMTFCFGRKTFEKTRASNSWCHCLSLIHYFLFVSSSLSRSTHESFTILFSFQWDAHD